jgi:hypothetical protein
VDDALFFADDKATLWAWREAVVARLARLRLTIHAGPALPRPVAEGCPFLGFTVFRAERRLKRRKGIAYRRRLKRLLASYAAGDIPLEQVEDSLRGWVNHARTGDTWGLRQAVLTALPVFAPEFSIH